MTIIEKEKFFEELKYTASQYVESIHKYVEQLTKATETNETAKSIRSAFQLQIDRINTLADQCVVALNNPNKKKGLAKYLVIVSQMEDLILQIVSVSLRNEVGIEETTDLLSFAEKFNDMYGKLLNEAKERK